MNPRHAAAFAMVGWYLMTLPAMAMDRENDSLSDVSGSGAILEMLSGQIYRFDDVDQVDSALWLATDDVVLICTKSVVYKGKPLKLYTVINKDQSGEEVGVERLK